jgi:hypothetical protein
MFKKDDNEEIGTFWARIVWRGERETERLDFLVPNGAVRHEKMPILGSNAKEMRLRFVIRKIKSPKYRIRSVDALILRCQIFSATARFATKKKVGALVERMEPYSSSK